MQNIQKTQYNKGYTAASSVSALKERNGLILGIAMLFAAALILAAVPSGTVKAGSDSSYSYDTPSYDTYSYDTPSYDTYSYDTPSYDTYSYDTPSYDTYSYDTPSYDTYSYNAPSYDTYSYDTYAYSAPSYSYVPPVIPQTYFPVVAYNYTTPSYTYPTYSYPAPCQTGCSNPVPPQTQPLNGYCTISPSSVFLGQPVTLVASASGGNGNYVYSWTGTDGLIGNGQSLTYTYNAYGVQTASVRIQSNGQTITANCNTNVQNTPVVPNNLAVYCTANPAYNDQYYNNVQQNITWTAYPSGGSGNYSYVWTGSNGLTGTGQSVSQYYSYGGTQTATVTVYSNGQSVTASCNGTTTTGSTGNLAVYCVANTNNTFSNTNPTVTWTAYPSGSYNNGYYSGSNYYNNGQYTYSWTGTEGLSGSNQTVSTTYPDGGIKYAYVTVYSNGQSVSASCNTTLGTVASNITVISPNTTGTPVAGVFLNQVPDTGISWNLKTELFVAGLVIWSAFVAYVIIESRKAKLALAGMNGENGQDTNSKEYAFRMANMKRRGLIQ